MSLKRDTIFVYIDQGVEKEIKVVGSKKIKARMKVTRDQLSRQVLQFASDLASIRSLHKKLWPSKMPEFPILKVSRLPTWESWDKMTFRCIPWG